MNFPSQVPNPAIRRISLYLRQLEALQADRISTVSSHKLAEPLGLTDTQVRKDLAYFGQFGRPGVGYEVMPLIHRLRGILGTDRISRILLVGAGNLGRAITAYQGFRAKGFELVAMFDSDPRKIGQHVAGMPVQPMSDLPRAVTQHDAHLAVIAVPAPVAQHVTDQLIAAGVRGILNFAPTRLNTPSAITVLNLDVAAHLEQLSFLINVDSRGMTGDADGMAMDAPGPMDSEKAAADAPETAGSKEILIVDDSEASAVFLTQIVEDCGHRFRVARDGKEASASLKERCPDLVLLDLMMPHKSGIAVFREMKEDPDLKKIPIIIVTGASEVTGVDFKTGEETSRKAYEDDVGKRFGVVLHEILKGLKPDGFIEKPIDPKLLSEKIEDLLA